jgi:hypothetical protein
MHWPDKKLVLALFAAGATSFLAGFAYVKLIGQLACSVETLVCNINEAIGAYAVVIWAILGPLIFALVLAIARNRAALLGAAILLIVPPVAFLLITQIEHATYIGFEPEQQFRAFLVSFVPPALTILVQYLILRLVVPRAPEAKP